ncbi:hypothetical protein ABBQ32_007428 [Trebouxia sp. C0010 RCD-2024]
MMAHSSFDTVTSHRHTQPWSLVWCSPRRPEAEHCADEVGASNELPESQELDALYDRALIRRSVSQVSSSQLGNLARLAAATKLVAQTPSNGAGAIGLVPLLTLEQAQA